MAESETDAAYSDEEFGSDHEEYDGGYEDFADEDAVVDTMQDAAHDGSSVNDKEHEVVDEDAEQYGGEFDGDEQTVADSDSPKVENDVAMREKILTTATAEPHVDKLEGPPGTNAVTSQDQSDSSNDSEAESSNDTEHDIPISLPNNAAPPSTPSEESMNKRRSSVPDSAISRLSDDYPPKAQFVRAGSMPMVMSDRPVDKWMDTLPQELSPARTGRSRKQNVLPVLDEIHAQNSVDEEFNADEGEGCTDDNNSVSSISNSWTRAQSYKDLQCQKTIVPIRRAQSLLYTGSLPSVVEVLHGEDAVEAGSDHDNEDSYSDEDDEDNYDDGSQASFQSENENDTPANTGRPESGPSSILDKASVPTDNSTQAEHLISCKGEATIPAGGSSSSPVTQNPTNAAASDEPSLLEENDTSLPQKSHTKDDDYADDEFPRDSNTPHFEGQDTPHKSSGDVDVVEFIEDGRRETHTLRQEARTLLQQQQQYESEPPVQQIITPSPSGSSAELSEQLVGNHKKWDDIGAEKYATPFDDDEEEFADVDGEVPNQDTSDQDVLVSEHDGLGNYEFDTDDYEKHDVEAAVHGKLNAPTQIVDPEKSVRVDPNLPPSTIAVDRVQSCSETSCTFDSTIKAEHEVSLTPPSETPIPNGVVLEATETQSASVQSPQPKGMDSPGLPSSAGADKKTATITNESPKSNRSQKTQVPSQPARPKQLVSTSPQQAVPIKPSRPSGNRPTPLAPVSSSQSHPTTTPRSSRGKLRNLASECKTPNPNPVVCNTVEMTGGSSREHTAENSPARKQESPSKYRNGVSSPRSPSKTYSGAYQYLPNEYPELPRKEPVPSQKANSKPSTRGIAKRRLLQPVRTPANLRFDLPKMDKTKRDWLFVNMFRHGDDLSKFEAFVPPTLLARPPAPKETKKRPLSARQIYGNPHTSGSISSGRKLLQQPNPQMQERERKWVATTQHDSKLPAYDSILDKYCTTVTSPVVQRQIYEARHQDLSPQLAFVLEKRVEKHCRKGLNDSFGGVSSSYKTEIVPTSPGDGMRPRQISTRPQNKSGLLPVASPTTVEEE